MVGVGIVVDICICIGIRVGVSTCIGDGIGSISQHLASGGIWAGSIWQHLGSSVKSWIIWQHLGAPGIIWRHLAASELAASGGIWDPPAASGSIWHHLAASGSIRHHLGCPAERSELWRLEIEPWAGNQALGPEIEKKHQFLCETVNRNCFWDQKSMKNHLFLSFFENQSNWDRLGPF